MAASRSWTLPLLGAVALVPFPTAPLSWILIVPIQARISRGLTSTTPNALTGPTATD